MKTEIMKLINQFNILYLILSLWVFSYSGAAFSQASSSPAFLTSPSTNDISNPTTNSVVRVGGGCSGTLIAANLVLTAGHCMGGWIYPNQEPIPIDWVAFRDSVPIHFGLERNDPLLTAYATHWSWAGPDDIWILKLDRDIPPSIAIPSRVLTRFPYEVNVGGWFSPFPWLNTWPQRVSSFLRDKNLLMSGWGLDENNSFPPQRKVLGASFVEFPHRREHGTQVNALLVRGDAGGAPRPGDSGSPLYWINERTGVRHVLGELQQTSGSYISTFGIGLGDEDKPNLRNWVDYLLYQEVIEHNPFIRQSQLLPLFSWYHPQRGDNFATTDRRWTVDVNAKEYDSSMEHFHIIHQQSRGRYKNYRFEGYIFSPRSPQPSGTVPLFSWWNASRKDNFSTTDPRWAMNPRDINWRGEHISNGRRQAGYKMYRLEGYIFDPKLPQPPNTIPVYSWWNPKRGDNFLTTDPRWSMSPTEARWNGEHISNGRRKNGYYMFRLEGYVYPPLRQPLD